MITITVIFTTTMSDLSDPSDLQRELNNLLSRDVSSYPQWQDQTTVTSPDLSSDYDNATTLGNFGDEWGYYALPEPLEDQLFLQQPPLLGQSPATLLQSYPPVVQNNTFNNTRSFASAGLKAAPQFDQLGPHRIIGTTPSPGAFSEPENVEPNPDSENNNTRDLVIPNLKMGYHLNTLGRITWLMVSDNLFIQLYFYC
jgi:hypothetical protein